MGQDQISQQEAESGIRRRSIIDGLKAGALGAAFLATMGPVGAALVSKPANAQSAGLSDATILNFALNLEYLEAEFYLRAVTGVGLSNSQVTGIGTVGGVNGGSKVPFKTGLYQQVATDIAIDEQRHVQFLRSALGDNAAARPLIDLAGGFQGAAQAAGLIDANTPFFNPFADEVSFLLGAFIFEDVGVTAYAGAASLISDKTYLSAAASILAVEGYHGGSVRTLLNMVGGKAPFITQAIANLRSKATGAVTDNGITTPSTGIANIAPTDSNGLAYQRTVSQVLNIVTNGNASTGNGGFFPNGMNLGNS